LKEVKLKVQRVKKDRVLQTPEINNELDISGIPSE